MGLLGLPVDLAKYDFMRFPATEEYGVLVRTDSLLTQKKRLAPQDLLNVPLMLPERMLVRNELASWFGDLYDKLNIRMTYNLLYNAAMLVRQGMGIALCLRLDSTYDGLTFIPITLDQTTGSVLAWKKHQSYAPAVTALIAYLDTAVHE